ncbi:hypothetical protein Acid345_2750 [Candidatus Koribacter versatilis Ellin345]|uniref:Uncharacterized protein n=1 Tax=Koribacter versatilis (strain Ellin345) TaxID=204669 RepID=Q1IMZ9_KORVE|nr:hypothetical protein [Candidatus Koribacter versatilis]ABF41751.1 hypothetical protein Acid345_2750 [Candidatus Koribacter versatilis Ellin345]
MTHPTRMLLLAAATFAWLAPMALTQDSRPLGDIARDVRARKEAKATGIEMAQGDAVTADASVPTSPRPDGAATQTDPTKLVIAAGTKIKIDTQNQIVSAAVSDESGVLVPAQAKISFDVSPVYFDPRYTPAATAPQKMVRLTSITIGDKSYDVDTNSVTVPDSMREVTVTLRRPLTLPR